MSFRNTSLLFLIFLLLISCKGLRYYNSTSNPAGIGVIMQSPTTYYTNLQQQDSISFYLVNNNSETIVIPHWWSDLVVIGQSRFYPKEITLRAQPMDLRIKALSIEPKDTVLLIKVPIQYFLNADKNWTYKTKKVNGPHLMSAKKFYPYIYFTAELNSQLTNQNESIKIRSEKTKITLAPFKEQNLKNDKAELGISSDVPFFDTKTKSGNLICKINNLMDLSIPLFIDAGAVRFKLYGYSPNRTAIMHTEFVLNNGKLPVAPLTIDGKTNGVITIPLEQVLFSEPPKVPMYFWTWKKGTPPISPLVYGKKEIGVEVEFWFGIVVDGKEYLSNTVKIQIKK